MNDTSRTIVVTGATGRQGGAVVRHLMRSAYGFRIRALTRNPGSPRAQALITHGVELVRGDLNDRASLDRALAGAYGVFAVQDFWEHGAKAEVLQGKCLADAARATGVRHFVFASVGAADRGTGVSHYETKWEVEQHLRHLRLAVTVLRPVFFMDLFDDPKYPSPAVWGILAGALGNKKTLQMIAVDDIGAVAAHAFERPDMYVGRAIELAGDELTIPEAAKAYRDVTQRAPRYVRIPTWPVGLFNRDAANGLRWLKDAGWRTNIADARADHPHLKTFAQWLRLRGGP